MQLAIETDDKGDDTQWLTYWYVVVINRTNFTKGLYML